MKYTSTRIMLCAAVATAVLLVASLLAPQLFGVYGLLLALAVTFIAAIFSVARQRRNTVLVLACLSTTVCVVSVIAFCRVWGLAFTEGPPSLSHPGYGGQSDFFLWLALASAFATILLLLGGSLWPSRRGGASSARRRPATSARPRATARPRRP